MLKCDGYIRADWSPEQVCGRLKHEGVIELHHETIDQYISDDKANGGTLYKHLRQQRKTYRKRYGCAHNRTAIADRVGIEDRSQDVNKRERVGDWKADTVIGKKTQRSYRHTG
ncbi:MAG: IS30 family transposase [Gammaproteobacteria bacterium]|nr:IS30 family transposase [Gammaproteobacteria bacterium]